MSARLRDSSGFTLLELLITTVISLALGVGGFAFFRAQVRSLTDQSAGLDAIEGARAAVDFMGNSIRTTGANPAGTWNPTGTCATGLSSARSDRLTITADTDGDGTAEVTTFRYDSATKSIIRTYQGVDDTLIKNVPSGGLTFSYYVAGNPNPVTLSGSPAQVPNGTCDNVTNILISVQVQAAHAVNVSNVSLASRVALRNRKAVLNRL